MGAITYFGKNRNQMLFARMRVPKLAKNGLNSSFEVWVGFEGMDSEWGTGTVANAER